ncbi:MAG TPA: MFS transporter, partial [Ottowia sp.]|nr:MFS transporter [Ottowia sp.]
MFKSLKAQGALGITLAAAGILMITMGARQSIGLFVGPINTSTGLGIATISFALAIAQFTWGAVQPLAGAAADRWGPRAVLIGGVFMLAVGTALTPLMGSGPGLIFAQGLLVAAGAGAGSFSVLIGAAAQRIPAASR